MGKSTTTNKISFPANYQELLTDSSNYLEAANSDVAEAVGICGSIEASGLLDTLSEELAEEGISSSITELHQNIINFYGDTTGASVIINTLFNSFVESIDLIKNDIDKDLNNIDTSNLSAYTLELLEKYKNGEIDITEFFTQSDDVINELASAGISAFKKLTKAALTQTIKHYLQTGVVQTLATYGLVVADDIFDMNFVKAGILAAKTFITNKVKQIASTASGDMAEAATGGVASSKFASFLNSPLGKNLATATIAFAANMATYWANDGKITGAETVEAAARAGLAVASNMLGTAFVTALGLAPETLGTSIVAALVSVGVTIVGGWIIDAIKHEINYMDGEIPREFKPITQEDIDSILAENNVQFKNGAENLNEFYGEGSIKDIEAKLKAQGYPPEVVDVIIATAQGTSPETYGEDGYWTPEYQAMQDYFVNNSFADEMNDETIESLYLGDPDDFDAYLEEYHKMQATFGADQEYDKNLLAALCRNAMRYGTLYL